MLSTVGSILIAVLILLLTITVHEFGHYIVGKLFKFKITEFAIGMGPAVYKKVKKNGEIFSIRIFPLGGFCAFEGEDEDENTVKADNENAPYAEYQGGEADGRAAETEKPAYSAINAEKPQKKELSPNAFNNKKPWQRILVLVAGATVNFLVAVLIIVLNFSIYGHFAYRVNTVAPIGAYDAAADGYSLRGDDVIIDINGKFLYLTTDFTDALKGGKRGDIVRVGVLRGGARQEIEVALRNDVVVESLNDFASAYLALGVACVPYIPEGDGSPIKNGEGILAIKDADKFDDCTKISSLRQFGEELAEYSAGDKVGVWMTSSDPDDADGRQLIELSLSDNFATEKAEFENELSSSPQTAYKHIIRDYLGIEYYSPAFQMSSVSVRLSFGEILYRPLVYSFKTVGTTFRAFGQLFSGKLSITALSGPVSTISMTSEYVKNGFNYILEIAAFIGISVAIFNLLPIPALDGARAVFVAIEWVRGKPINRKVEGAIHAVGLVVLLIFAVLVDVLKLFI